MQHFGRINLADIFNACFNKLPRSVSFLCPPQRSLAPWACALYYKPISYELCVPEGTVRHQLLWWEWMLRNIICNNNKGAKVYRNILHFFVEQSI